MENPNKYQKIEKPKKQIPRKPINDEHIEIESEVPHEDNEFRLSGTLGGGLVKGTRKIESSEVRPDKGM